MGNELLRHHGNREVWKYFTLIELLMRKSCKIGFSFRQQQDRAGRCQSPDPVSSFFLLLFNCFPVQLFKCFPVPSYFRVPCSSVLTSRVKMRIFTLIELLIIKTCQIYIITFYLFILCYPSTFHIARLR